MKIVTRIESRDFDLMAEAVGAVMAPFGSLAGSVGAAMAAVSKLSEQRGMLGSAEVAALWTAREVAGMSQLSTLVVDEFGFGWITPTSGARLRVSKHEGGFAISMDAGSGRGTSRIEEIRSAGPRVAWRVEED